MKLFDLFDRSEEKISSEFGNIDITSVVSNSGEVTEGSAFVCLKGKKYNGCEFASEAMKHGAKVIVCEKDELCGKCMDFPVIEVRSARRALSYMLDAFYGHPADNMKLIAVTGTNGKTSVTYMLKSIFEQANYKCGLIGTVEHFSGKKRIPAENINRLANMTTPDPEQLYKILSIMKNDGVGYVFMEASSHALALDKLAPLHFETAILTNLTPEHLDFHGDMDNYFKAKSKLFRMSEKAILNMDDKYYPGFAEICAGITKTCSTKNNCADYYAFDIKNMTSCETEYYFRVADVRAEIKSNIPGEFTIMNTLEAAACAMESGISLNCVQNAIMSFKGVCGRLERIELPQRITFSVFIDYAHTPDALENLLESVRNFREENQRIVLVFGCGGNRDKSKRHKMGEIASRMADFTVITSDNSRYENRNNIISDIISGIKDKNNYKVIADRRSAIEYVIRNALEKDIIILAGKGHEKYEITGDKRLPFDENKIVKEIVEDLKEPSDNGEI